MDTYSVKRTIHFFEMCLLEVEGGRLEMMINSNKRGRYGIIENVFVEQEHRNKGIATKLIQEAKKTANVLKMYKIVLTCSKDLMQFYSNQEFEWQENGQAYCMRIDLNG